MALLTRSIVALVLFGCLSAAGAATAPQLDTTSGRTEDRQQLRVLLDRMEAAISALDIEAVLKLTQPEVIVTWQNAEVSRGQAQVRAYYDRMIKGGAPIVKRFSTQATLGGPAVFYGDSATAYGTTVDTYDLADGMSFKLNANWSTTIVKVNGEWKVAALHFSTNLFDNALLEAAKRAAWVAGGVAFLAGLLVGWLVWRWRGRKA